MSRLWDVAEGLAGAAVAVALATVLVVAAANLRPPPAPTGTRHEPPAAVGARVLTEHGPGTITAQIAMADGPAWQVRLDTGRHVVLYRAHFQVLQPPPTPRARPVAHFHPPVLR